MFRGPRTLFSLWWCVWNFTDTLVLDCRPVGRIMQVFPCIRICLPIKCGGIMTCWCRLINNITITTSIAHEYICSFAIFSCTFSGLFKILINFFPSSPICISFTCPLFLSTPHTDWTSCWCLRACDRSIPFDQKVNGSQGRLAVFKVMSDSFFGFCLPISSCISNIGQQPGRASATVSTNAWVSIRTKQREQNYCSLILPVLHRI